MVGRIRRSRFKTGICPKFRIFAVTFGGEIAIHFSTAFRVVFADERNARRRFYLQAVRQAANDLVLNFCNTFQDCRAKLCIFTFKRLRKLFGNFTAHRHRRVQVVVCGVFRTVQIIFVEENEIGSRFFKKIDVVCRAIRCHFTKQHFKLLEINALDFFPFIHCRGHRERKVEGGTTHISRVLVRVIQESFQRLAFGVHVNELVPGQVFAVDTVFEQRLVIRFLHFYGSVEFTPTKIFVSECKRALGMYHVGQGVIVNGYTNGHLVAVVTDFHRERTRIVTCGLFVGYFQRNPNALVACRQYVVTVFRCRIQRNECIGIPTERCRRVYVPNLGHSYVFLMIECKRIRGEFFAVCGRQVGRFHFVILPARRTNHNLRRFVFVSKRFDGQKVIVVAVGIIKVL